MFDFTIRQVEVFLAVCEHRGFRRTADRLGLSEASVSHHVRTLEAALGYALFERQRGTTSSLTADGERFRQEAAEFAALGRRMGRRGAESAAPPRLSLNIYVGPVIFDSCVRPALSKLLDLFPNIDFNFVKDITRSEVLRRLKTGALDGALMAARGERQLPRSIVISKFGCGIYGNRAMAEQARRHGISAVPFLLNNPDLIDKTDQVNLLKANGIANPVFSSVYQFHDSAVAMAIQGRGLLATLDELVAQYDPGGELSLVKPLPDGERRLVLRPTLDPEIARKLTGFLAATLDESAALRAPALR